MDSMKFSVCMSVYRRDDPVWFRQALDSVLHQTVVPDEIVLVVDGPVTDELDRVIQEAEASGQIRAIRLRENRGHGNARKVGLENCVNDLVALMDSDDLSLPDRFEKQLRAFLADPGLSMVGGQISEFVGAAEHVVGIREVLLTDREIKKDIRIRCPFNQVTVMVNRHHVASAGGYQDWYQNEDYYLWVRMYLKGLRFANVPDILVNVRVGEDMYRRRGGWKYFRFGVLPG